jgi:hypothetical protein
MTKDIKPTIPEIRERMLEITSEMSKLTRELSKLARLTKRRSPIRRAPKGKAIRVTKALARKVNEFARDNPNLPLRDIGHLFTIDAGRVSEILHGFRNGKTT